VSRWTKHRIAPLALLAIVALAAPSAASAAPRHHDNRRHAQSRKGLSKKSHVKTVRFGKGGRGSGGGTDPGNDYPGIWLNRAQDSVFDPWGEYNRECTSFAAWALFSRNGFKMPFYDNASGWAAKARARGYAVNSTPAPGAIAWDAPWAHGAGWAGHVAYVENLVGGSVHIEEYNWDDHGHYNSRTVPASSFSAYIHFKDQQAPSGTPPGSPTPPTPKPTPTQPCPVIGSSSYKTPCGFTARTYNVYGAGTDGLYERTGPGTTYSTVSLLANNTSVNIACQAITSSAVNGSPVWDLLTDGYWVADYYMSTPNVGSYSPGISTCEYLGAPPPPPPPCASVQSAGYKTPCGYVAGAYHVYGTGSEGLYEHSGPGTSFSSVGLLANNTAIDIACQIITSSSVHGSPVWDLLTTSVWVSDYYVNTPVVGNYSAGLSTCVPA
jgi:surface antigen/uncharacterized protein YraI